MSDQASTEERIKVVIGGKTFYKVQTTSIRINQPPFKSKHQTKVQNKIARPKQRGMELSNRLYSTSHSTVQPRANGNRFTNQATTSTTYEANLIPVSRRKSHIER